MATNTPSVVYPAPAGTTFGRNEYADSLIQFHGEGMVKIGASIVYVHKGTFVDLRKVAQVTTVDANSVTVVSPEDLRGVKPFFGWA